MKNFLSLFFILTIKLKNVNSQATIGVDFGGNYMKVSMVSISKPIQTVIDRDSHRKTLTYIGVKDGYLVFGDAAKSLERKNPDCIVKNIEVIMGRKWEDSSVERFRKLNPFLKVQKDEKNGGVLIVFEKYNLTFTPVILFARLLDEIKIYSSAYSGYDIGEFFIAFPPFVDHSFIVAVKDAAFISNLKLLGISDISRTLITQYIVTRKKFLSEKINNVMFIDIGSTNTIVTIASVGLERGIKKDTTIPSFNVSSISYTEVGAGDFDEILANIFIKDFKKKQKIFEEIENINKVMTKFREQARNAKHCLTSTKDCRINVEDAFSGKSYISSINRDEFRSSCSESLEMIKNAIYRSLAIANIEKESLAEVVVMGGGSLMPVVQDVITQITHKSPSRVMNTDESNSAGAAILAAKSHKLFTVAELRSPAVNYYPIEVEYEANISVSVGVSRLKKARETLYSYLARQTSKKVLTINNVTHDMTIRLKYGQPPSNVQYSLDQFEIMEININGIAEALNKYHTSIPRSLLIHFKIDSLRILTPYKIEYLFDKNVTSGIFGKMGKVVMDLFGMKSNNTNETNKTVELDNSDTANKTESLSLNSTKHIESNSANTMSENFTVSLPFIINYLHLKPMTSEEKNFAREILKELHLKDELRAKTTKARNDLESAIFENEEIILSKKLIEYFTEDEFQNFINVTNAIKEAFEEEGYKYDLETATMKLTELKSAREIADDRRNEVANIDADIHALEETVKSTKGLAEYILKDEDMSKLIDQAYILDALNKCSSAIEWLNQTRLEQEKLNITDKRVLSSFHIRKKIKELEASGGQLFNKMQEAHELKEKIKKLAETANKTTQPINTTDAPSPINDQVTDKTKSEIFENTIEKEKIENKLEL